VIGIAADLVQADPPGDRVAEILLGRTLIVQDLDAARRVLDRLHGGFQVVTLGGEVVTSQGSVTGGREPGRQWGQMLAREREWRELPNQIRVAEALRSSLESQRAEVQEAMHQTRQDVASTISQQQEVQTSLLKAQAELLEYERQLDHVAETIDWRRIQLARLDSEERELVDQESALRDELARIAMHGATAKEEVADLQAQLDQLRGESLYQRLSEARTAAAVARGAWDHRRAALEELRERQSDHQAQVEAKRSRIASLQREQSELADQTKSLSLREAVIRSWLAALSGKIEPVESELKSLETERDQVAKDETELLARLRESENSHAQALLTQSRHQDRLQRLRRQIIDDFGLVEIEPTVGQAEQLPLPLAEMVSSLPVVNRLPEGLEEEIHQMRAQMRRLGYVNPNAPEDYAEALERHEFLTSQAADLEEAAQQLGQVVAELDEVMHREFLVMFEAVAGRFKKNFSRLFGGGAAHLELTMPDDISQTGVEIVARPPGKRPQTLALLSGGERSLTAVALIFALLEANLPPFCILDEVDAMLDEANVRRFRQMLEELALQTQFIVITHNRATITAADTIYGVSMGEDSVSQVVSLRLDGDRVASANAPAS
jgi:chromosome segregation protein